MNPATQDLAELNLDGPVQKIVNLTPHDVVLYVGDTAVFTITKSGQVARVQTKDQYVGHLDLESTQETGEHALQPVAVPVVMQRTTSIEGIPEPEDGTLYLVSSFVLNRSDRQDLIAPDTRKHYAVLDDNGQIKGVRRLRSNNYIDV